MCGVREGPRAARGRIANSARATGISDGMRAAEAATPGPTADAATAASTPERGAPSEPAGDQPAGAEAGQPERHSRQRRRQGPDQRFDRPRRERGDRPPNAGRHERQDRRQERHQERHQERRQEQRYQDRREKAPDPNSPFAKLAALKAQLEADAKERR